MPAQIQLRLTGGAANADPDASLGGVMSSEQLSATALNNLFDNVSPGESEDGDTEYRAIDLYNVGDATACSIQIFTGPTWRPNRVYTEGDLVRPDTPNGYVYQASAGTTDGSEPAWPTTTGDTVVDNTVTWTCLAESAANVQIALDSTTQSVVDESAAPTDVTFAYKDRNDKLPVGDIAAGSAQRVWIKRIVPAGIGNNNNDTFTLYAEYA